MHSYTSSVEYCPEGVKGPTGTTKFYLILLVMIYNPRFFPPPEKQSTFNMRQEPNQESILLRSSPPLIRQTELEWKLGKCPLGQMNTHWCLWPKSNTISCKVSPLPTKRLGIISLCSISTLRKSYMGPPVSSAISEYHLHITWSQNYKYISVQVYYYSCT
jgi:hypothetical protein